MTLFYTEMKSPVGILKIVAEDKGLVAILWEDEREGRVPLEEMQKNANHPILVDTVEQLSEYFAGKRTKFDVPLRPRGTEFQKQVWNALRKIPFGVTKSYGELASEIGNPKASRAVGAANGRNPISIIVPCHRVIGSNGTLTGFAGGLKAKEVLLSGEGLKTPRD